MLRYIIDCNDEYILAFYPIYRQAVFDQRDVESAVVSCANWLGTSAHDESANIDRTQIFGGTDAPTVCFSLGVQAKSSTDVQELGSKYTVSGTDPVSQGRVSQRAGRNNAEHPQEHRDHQHSYHKVSVEFYQR